MLIEVIHPVSIGQPKSQFETNQELIWFSTFWQKKLNYRFLYKCVHKAWQHTSLCETREFTRTVVAQWM